MEVLTTVREVRGYVKACRSQGKSIGLVPTMGFFHE
ncbi:MAG: pantoate--beta-alanine ligase, partial [Clostridia bacterium]|nr:pantoate--beta-alanine ligase [Clostridia bacterium]